MPKPRDSQRSKLYAAENAAFRKFSDRHSLTIEECTDVVRRIERSQLWADFEAEANERGHNLKPWAQRPINVLAGRGGGWANHAEISLGGWARCEWVILHEMAHTAVTRIYGLNTVPWHGWEFASIYLRMVSRFMGSEAAAKLKAEFKAKRVKHTAPRAKRELTPEQRAILANRLAEARAAKQLKAAGYLG
jgi:hypothetical protein